MALHINVRLAREDSERIEGELPVEELGAEFRDELIEFASPIQYRIEAEMHGDNLFVHGELSARLKLTCSRCLKPFDHEIALPEFVALAPLSGEDSLPQEGDFADLTPLLRDDILLALPTNPLCKPTCRGLAPKKSPRDSRLGGGAAPESPWSALDQLKL